MNIKNLILVSVIISTVFTEPALAAESGNEKAKEATSVFKTFKTDIRCMLSRKETCSPEQRKRLIVTGLALLAIVVAIGGTALGVKYAVLPTLAHRKIVQQFIEQDSGHINKEAIKKFIEDFTSDPQEEEVVGRIGQDIWNILDRLTEKQDNKVRFVVQGDQLLMHALPDQYKVIHDIASALNALGIFDALGIFKEKIVPLKGYGYVYFIASLKPQNKSR